MQIQINIPGELNKNLKLYKIYNDKKNLKVCIIEILEKYFDENFVKDGKRRN